MTMRSIACVLVLAGAADAAWAAPRCQLAGKPWLEGRVAGGGRVSRAVDAKLGEEIEVFVAAPGRLDGKAVVFGESRAPGRTPWPSACGALEVAWRRVEPRMQHTDTPSPNAEAKVYANAVVFGEKHGTWIGFDKLEYFETSMDVAAASGPSLRVRDAKPSAATGLERDDATAPLGTMRLAATVTFGTTRVSTPGASDAPDGQIADRVFRYSFRASDGFLGWLTSFFNVPYLFGSAGKGARSQAERYVGADCADILVAALRRAFPSRKHPLEYSSVADLVDELVRVAGPIELTPPCAPNDPCGGLPQAPSNVRWGRDIKPGDLLAIDYIGAEELPRSWDHIV
ncbi:MAG TPA: hypothetical protein VFF06_29315, partial [Polyangia bacterium]|nr:hypothetical protein [Polyangia bacterium]